MPTKPHRPYGEIVFDGATDSTINPSGVAVWEKDVDGYSASLGLYGGRDALSYMDYGVWANEQSDGTVAVGFGVGGLETRPENIPTTGTATYDGGVIGIAVNDGGAYSVLGDVSMTADFATGEVNGTFTNMFAVSTSAPVATAWNDITFNANIAAGTNEFSGTTAVTGGNVNPGGLDAGATGDIGGKFFGPGAEEVGGAWTISDGTTSAAGSFDAKQ